MWAKYAKNTLFLLFFENQKCKTHENYFYS